MMEEIVLKYGFQYVCYTGFLIFIFRKNLISFWDPYVFSLLSISSSIVLSSESTIYNYLCWSIFAFILGSFLSKKMNLDSCPTNSKEFNHIPLFGKIILVLALLYICVSIFNYLTQGVPLLAENPTEAKVDGFTGGNGWLRRVLFQLNFVEIGLLLLIITNKKTSSSLIIVLIIIVLLSLLNGSKSSLILFICILIFFIKNKNLWSESILHYRKSLKRLIPVMLVFAALLFVYIALKESELENQDPIYSIGFRLMEFGDVMLYYSDPSVQQYFEKYDWLDFILTEFNGITGLLRLDSYRLPIGSIMMDEYWSGMFSSDVITGPNTLFFIRGHIFFGFFGGIIYCFIIGYLITSLRWRCISYNGKNILTYTLWVNLFFLTPVFLKEFNLALSLLFDLFMLIILVLPIAVFLMEIQKRYAKV